MSASDTPRTIPIIQYVTGKGRIGDATWPTSAEVFAIWKQCAALGLRVTAEILRTGQVALCLEAPNHGDFDVRICENGPGPKSPPVQLEAMLREFNAKDFAKWKKDVS